MSQIKNALCYFMEPNEAEQWRYIFHLFDEEELDRRTISPDTLFKNCFQSDAWCFCSIIFLLVLWQSINTSVSNRQIEDLIDCGFRQQNYIKETTVRDWPFFKFISYSFKNHSLPVLIMKWKFSAKITRFITIGDCSFHV